MSTLECNYGVQVEFFEWTFFGKVNDSVLVDDDDGQVVASDYRTTGVCAENYPELV